MTTRWRRRAAPRFVLLLAAALAVLSCEDATDPVIRSGPPHAVRIVGGQDQSGAVGHELQDPVEVRVVDAEEQPVAGQIVNFRVAAGGGSVFAGAAITTADGIAKERWTLGTVAADSQRLEARAVDPVTGAAITFATFRATATPGAPESMTKFAGDQQTIAAGSSATDSLAVLVRDAFGNPVSGVVVTWATTAGTLSASNATTNAEGVAHVRWTGATSASGAWEVTAVAGALNATFTATPAPAAPSQLLLLTSAAGAMAGSAFTTQPQLRLVDSYGNTVAVGSPLSMAVSDGASIVGTATASLASGVATFSSVGLGGLAGSYTLTFTPDVAGVAPVTQEIVLAPGAASTYGVTLARSTIEIGDTVTVRAQLRDAYQNAVSSPARTVQWLTHISFARGTFVPAYAQTDAHGVATAVFTADSVFTQDSALVFAYDSVDGQWGFQAYGTIRVMRAPPVRLRFLVPPPSTAGYDVHQQISVSVADRFGNTVPAAAPRTVSIAVAPGSPVGATFGGPATATTASGIAHFQVYFPVPGDGYRLLATSDGLEGTTSTAFTVDDQGTLLLTAFDLGGVAVAGTKLYLSARLTDGWIIHNVHDVHDSRRTQSGNAPLGVVGNTEFLAVLQETGTTQASSRIVRATVAGAPMAAFDLAPTASCPPARDFLYDGTWFFVGCVSASSNPSPRLLRVGASDGSLLTLVGASPSAFAELGDHVYFVTGSEIQRVAKTGGAAAMLVTGVALTAPNRRRLAMTPDSLYWTDYSAPNARIQSAPIGGGSASTVVPDLHPNTWGLRAEGEWMYFIENFTLKRFHIVSPVTVETVLPGEIVSDFDFDDSSLYWISARSVKKTPHP